jgi:methionine aminopeptidase
MVFAIEPFACNGRGYITEKGKAEVFMMVRPPLRAKGLDKGVLRVIESWRGLPIARRYFEGHDPAVVEGHADQAGSPGLLDALPPVGGSRGRHGRADRALDLPVSGRGRDPDRLRRGP